MVFKPFTHLARQSFGKTFTHGYAQSVVAATQSSYASSATSLAPFGNHPANRCGRPGTSQLHTAFQNVPGPFNPVSKSGQGASENTETNKGGLEAYYEAWQKHEQHDEDGREWKQFQFTKRIGWKAPSVIPEGKGKEWADVSGRPEAKLERGSLDRSYSTSAVDDLKRAEDEIAEAKAVAQVNEAIAEEIRHIQQSASTDQEHTDKSPIAQDAPAKEPLNGATTSLTTSVLLPISSVETSARSSPSSGSTAATSIQDAESQGFLDRIGKLNAAHSYSQIPPVFESMLAQGVRPTAEAYNALLASVIHLSAAKHQVVPKALDVYSDMLRRKVSPDTPFYTTLIQLLSRRALDVFQAKNVMDKKRFRFGGSEENGRFLFASNEAEYNILTEDDALTNAVKLFETSTSMNQVRLYSPETYRLLITACALNNRVDYMIRAYSHMESKKVKPIAIMFPPMIGAFARSGDLGSAVECYNEYKALAIADNTGILSIISRKDNEVYAAVVKAYAICGKTDAGRRFFDRIVDSFVDVTENRKELLDAAQDTVVVDAFISERLDAGDFLGAFKIAEERNLTPEAHSRAMACVCVAAADNGDLSQAIKAYEHIPPNTMESSMASLSLLALHVRRGDLDSAVKYWTILKVSPFLSISFVEPTALYTIALIRNGRVEEGLTQARESFGLIRAAAKATNSRSNVTEEIDEAIELIGGSLTYTGVVPSTNANLSLLWAMVENGGLIAPVAERVLAGLGPEEIVGLCWQDMGLALRAEAGLLADGEISLDIAHPARFAHVFDIAVSSGHHLDEHTSGLIDRAVRKLSHERPGLVAKWQSHQQSSAEQARSHHSFTPLASPSLASPAPYAESYDPHAATTDYKGSSMISEELENHRNSFGLNEALTKFRNIRRTARHPRYIVYAKLITAAAKEGRTNLMHDILGMARNDVPFLLEYPVVRHGWASILDSMVGACLTVGRRTLAEQFHHELLGMGEAPTANTFGLYITTLKESTRTFDEATEAVTIFSRAIQEGVTPSSFLYNALIGKLGKARRIDDCLRYFQEMRTARIRPTSVTYGTIVNALCRVSDERLAEELFEEMESMPNYRPRPAPYNSLMQFYLTTKRDSKKVLAYYNRMQSNNIQPTMHTYKLLIDTYATLEPVDLKAAAHVLDIIRATGQRPEAVHYASLIHAKGCVLHDMAGARKTFDRVLARGEVRPQACLYQALFESMVANHCVVQTEEVLDSMSAYRVEMTPYIANTLIHGWAMENVIAKSKAVYESVGMEKREPSTYEAMTRAFLAVEDRDSALATVHEMLSRGYPSAVSSKILELLGPGMSRAGGVVLSELIA